MVDDFMTPKALRDLHAGVDKDSTWQRQLRLLQSLWRAEQGLNAAVHEGRLLGSRLRMPADEPTLDNFLTDNIKSVVKRELRLDAEPGKKPAKDPESGRFFAKPRIFNDLLSSQPLCFNLFGELQLDLSAATAWARELWPDRVERVTRILFEHSPGRRKLRYLGTKTAFDVFLEYKTPADENGFIGFEVKYHENLRVTAADVTDRVREVALKSKAFVDSEVASLEKPPLQQLWFDHLLALSMLQADKASWPGHGLYVVLYPKVNARCIKVLSAYQQQLAPVSAGAPTTFQALTLERVVEVLREKVGQPWVEAFHTRYLDPAPGPRLQKVLAKLSRAER